jgi:polyketide synthase 12
VSTEAQTADLSGIESEKDIEVLDKWLVRNKQNTQRITHRVFCIHPVGAGASMFSHFIYNPPKNTDVLAFQLPGRENRSNETNFEEVPLLVKAMAKAMAPLLDKPFIIMGHSFGGMIGFELIRYLRRHFGVLPLQLFISGTIAPQLTKKWKERDVINQTAIFTNSEEKLLALMSYIDDVEFLKRILPVMKKDMPMIMNYAYQKDELFTFPITAFAGDKDEVVLVEEVDRWREQTTGEFNLEVVPGDHWFLSRNKELILSRLTEAIQQMVPVN